MPAAIASTYPWRIEFDRRAQFKAALITAAFIALFWTTLYSLWQRWWSDADWSHGAIIPIFSLYLVHQKWELVRKCPIQMAWAGVPIVLLSLVLYVFNHTPWGRLLGSIAPYFMLLCLLGVIVLLCGVPVLRYAWVPWAYLLFAIPLPRPIYFRITDPLRRLAAGVATAVLSLFPDLHVLRLGSVIEYDYLGRVGQIGVADACSGMRSTITVCALGVAVAYVTDRAWWQRLILVAACVPIAVFCNLIRVVTTCLLHIFVDPKYAEGEYHMFLGLIVLLLALGLFSGLGWILSNLVVESAEEHPPDSTDAKNAPAA